MRWSNPSNSFSSITVSETTASKAQSTQAAKPENLQTYSTRAPGLQTHQKLPEDKDRLSNTASLAHRMPWATQGHHADIPLTQTLGTFLTPLGDMWLLQRCTIYTLKIKKHPIYLNPRLSSTSLPWNLIKPLQFILGEDHTSEEIHSQWNILLFIFKPHKSKAKPITGMKYPTNPPLPDGSRQSQSS